MPLFRAEATRTHHHRTSKWRGKWKKDRDQAIAQAKRWHEREPEALIIVVSDTGEKVTLKEMEHR